jgi:hypothetical protein
MVVMPEACGYNMLLGNEIMTALHADIMRSLKSMRFRFGDVVATVPMLPHEVIEPLNCSRVFKLVNMKEAWVNNQPPVIELESKNA